MPQEDPLTAEETEQFRQKLLERRAEIVGDIEDIGAERSQDADKPTTGTTTSNVPTHQADAAGDGLSREKPLHLTEHERNLVADIDEAIERIRLGTYGKCAEDGGPISRKRLEAKPWARLCLKHAESAAGA